MIVEVEAADVFGALVPGHNEAGVECRADRGNVGVLAGENDLVDDREEKRGCAVVCRAQEEAGMVVRDRKPRSSTRNPR